jgi:integrase
MRLGEVLSLRWENVLGDRIVLPRMEAKQKKEKIVPILGTVAAIFKDLQAANSKAEYVIPLDRSSLQIGVKRLMAKIRELSGIKDFIFHGLRHTAAEIMVSLDKNFLFPRYVEFPLRSMNSPS